jgi:hypothetical protein
VHHVTEFRSSVEIGFDRDHATKVLSFVGHSEHPRSVVTHCKNANEMKKSARIAGLASRSNRLSDHPPDSALGAVVLRQDHLPPARYRRPRPPVRDRSPWFSVSSRNQISQPISSLTSLQSLPIAGKMSCGETSTWRRVGLDAGAARITTCWSRKSETKRQSLSTPFLGRLRRVGRRCRIRSLKDVHASGKPSQLVRKQLTPALLRRYLPLETADLFRDTLLFCPKLLDRLLEISHSFSSRLVGDLRTRRQFSLGLNNSYWRGIVSNTIAGPKHCSDGNREKKKENRRQYAARSSWLAVDAITWGEVAHPGSKPTTID